MHHERKEEQMVQLQRPSHVYMGGALRSWDEATVHVSSESLIRATSVFEGIKGYWDTSGTTFSLLALREHFERLHRSAKLLHLPFDMTFEAFSDACCDLVQVLLVRGRDLWLRPTLLAVEGHWGLDTVTDLVITGYTLEQERPTAIEVGVSNWQRASDLALPARIKSSANYQVSRLARIEGRRHGYQDMILRNSAGRVAEASGACVLMVRGERLITPPSSEGCLESITVGVIEHICDGLGIEFVRRPVEFSELYVADEAFLAGTLAELVPVHAIDGHAIGDTTPVTEALAERFWQIVRRERQEPQIALHVVPADVSGTYDSDAARSDSAVRTS